MLMLVTYDVATHDAEGSAAPAADRPALSGLRATGAVFGLRVPGGSGAVDHTSALLVTEMDPDQDSLRFYRLGSNWRPRIEHIGMKKAYDPEAPLVM